MEKIDFKSLDDINGLIPVIVQDSETKDVLMLAYMNQESLKITLELKKVCFFSRSRQKLWIKGETSGNFLELVEIKIDCDNDSLLVFAKPSGNTCHTGFYSCFNTQKSLYKKDKSLTKTEKINIMKSIYKK